MKIISIFLILLCSTFNLAAQSEQVFNEAKAPLFRDPIHDGAADPIVFYCKEEKAWYMFYTNRRANVEIHGTNWCYGTKIGVAASTDNGKTWNYRGTLDLDFKKGVNTFWAPHVIYDKGVYHLFVTYIDGIYETWSGIGKIAHYTSNDLWDWKFDQLIPLTKDAVLDATIHRKSDGRWGMWYKNARLGYTVEAVSDDLKTWTNLPQTIANDSPHEAPFVFFHQGYYWLLTDQWNGLGVYRSKDSDGWEKKGVILGDKGKRKDDGVRASHPCVVVTDQNVYIFYFTHPGWEKEGGWGDDSGKLNETGVLPHSYRRSSIQVAELVFKDDMIYCNRNESFNFFLPDL